MNWLERQFRLREHGTNARREVLAGVTTFLTMSYIIIVNPIILSQAKGSDGQPMDLGAITFATCVCSFVCSVLIGLLANYPIAGAPGMGHNVFFAITVCTLMGYTWEQALSAVFLSGVLFLLLSLVRFRETLVNAIPNTLKHSIAVGIGLLITLVGLEWGGFVKASLGTIIGLGDLRSPAVLIAGGGFLVMAILTVLKVQGAILLGLLASLVIALLTGKASFTGVVGAPPSPLPTLAHWDFAGLFATGAGFLAIVFVFFLTDVFDTVGTLIGVGAQAGLMQNGKLPRAGRALLGDAVATTLGGVLGTSTITAYIESAAGVVAGGRTGLTAVVTGVLMLLGLFFTPLVQMMSASIPVTWELQPGLSFSHFQYPIIAPALVLVGSFMLTGVRHIHWEDFTESLPAFLTIVMMPVTFSITEGIAFGFISYVVLKAVSRRLHEVHWLVVLCAVLFVLRYLFMAG